MPWTCRECSQPNAEGQPQCAACGWVRTPDRIALVSQVTGGRTSMGVSTAVGRRLLAGFAGDEAAYAAEPQFEIVRAADHWALRHSPAARNPTYWNGSPVGPEPCPLADGGVISIGPKALRLTVLFEFA